MIQHVVDRSVGENARIKPCGLVTIGPLGTVAEATASCPLRTVAVASVG